MAEVVLTILMILLVPLGLVLIAIILLQESKSGGLSGAFGGSGESLLGARAGRELSRWTMWGTTVFVVVLIAVGILCNVRQRHGALLGAKPSAEETAEPGQEVPVTLPDAGTEIPVPEAGTETPVTAPEAGTETPAPAPAAEAPAPAPAPETPAPEAPAEAPAPAPAPETPAPEAPEEAPAPAPAETGTPAPAPAEGQ